MPADERDRNGLDARRLAAIVDVMQEQPDLARCQLRVSNTWLGGVHSRSAINGFQGAGREHGRSATFRVDGDHPLVLVGRDQGPMPAEHLLHALAACLTAGLANTATAHGVHLDEIVSNATGDLDLQGALGLHPEVRNGFQHVSVTLTVRARAAPDVIRHLVELSCARSPVLDVLANGTPVNVNVITA